MSALQPTSTETLPIGSEEIAVAEADSVVKGPNTWQIMWTSKKARVGWTMLAFFTLVAILAPLIAPYSRDNISFDQLLAPSSAHLLGTTTQGGDIFSQLVWGTRVSLLVGLFGGLFATGAALLIGMIAGYAEGTWLDDILSFIMNIFMVVPVLPLMVVLASYVTVRNLWFTVFVIGITSWAGPARAKRAQIITLRNRDFVTAAKFAGENTFTIVFREILPSMISLVAASFFGAASGAIMAEAGLSYLGLGDTSSVSWGTMMQQAQMQGAASQGLWIWLLAPGITLALLITSFVLINFGIDLLTNPNLREDA